MVGTWLAIFLARKVLPYLAERGPSQLRLYLLGAVPIVRLVLLTPWATHDLVKAYAFDMRDQFSFISDLTIRGKLAISDCGACEVAAAVAGEKEFRAH